MFQNIRFSLRISILTIYVTTFTVLIAALILCQRIMLYEAIYSTSNHIMKNASSAVLKRLSLQIAPAATSAKLARHLIEHDLINNQKMSDFTYYVANNLPNPQLPYSVRITGWGDTKGSSFETSLEPDGTFSTLIINNKKEPPEYVRIYRDLDGKVIKSENIFRNYDPRERPWYKSAVHANKLVWSDVFLSYPYKNPSIAVAVPIYKHNTLQGVFEIEVKLVAISKFLSTLNVGDNGEVFIVNAKNELVAYPGMIKPIGSQKNITKLAALEAYDKPWLNLAFHLFNKNHTSQFQYTYDNSRYIASFTDIPEFSTYGWRVGIVIPEKSIIGQLEKTNYTITGFSLLILLIGIFIVSFFSKLISAPIKSLIVESQAIKNFHLEGDKTIRSIIKEVDLLGLAIRSMKMNLRSFQKYIPANLVRQLIYSGKDIQVGGIKKNLTIFFSDIQNFTTLSETMDSTQLMLHLCNYLDELSMIILDEKGTIDKYIGDSIMAFWGAPLPDKQHCFHACITALRCKKKLDELNELWETQGKSPLITRIGIHTGEAIVGNIGSKERVNYTVLGDSINIASRLEKINKIYATYIVVSEDVVKTVGNQFVFRFLDRTAIKGRKGSANIYELMDKNQENLSFDLHQYQYYFSKGFNSYQKQNWSDAISNFNQCIKFYPKDNLAPIYIKRCTLFINNPPSPDWDGVWRE